MEPLFYNAMDSSSAAVLTIPAARNTADVLYTCVIESHEHGRTTKKPIRNYVNSYVYSEHHFFMLYFALFYRSIDAHVRKSIFVKYS